jgi:hypothetical protein
VRGGRESYSILLPSSVFRFTKQVSNSKTSGVPNQRFKLTEVAVDDYAAREYAENDMISKYVRATRYMDPAVRRRSLTAVR